MIPSPFVCVRLEALLSNRSGLPFFIKTVKGIDLYTVEKTSALSFSGGYFFKRVCGRTGKGYRGIPGPMDDVEKNGFLFPPSW
uniref:Uncharacterized protein n=1 Tax=Klebsiella pneumoniae TaxID=573 RepID=A0A8B0SS09_KLEPN|nr:hypothetical protein [Klebsiella pneumoniae]